MENQNEEIVGLRLSKRYKRYLQRLATNQGLSMAQWLRKKIAIDIWEGIKSTAEMVATMIAAEESGVPEKIAVKLNKADEAILIIPAEKQEEFKKRVNELYLIERKKRMEDKDVKFNGLENELKEIDADCTMKEWEDSQEMPFKDVF